MKLKLKRIDNLTLISITSIILVYALSYISLCLKVGTMMFCGILIGCVMASVIVDYYYAVKHNKDMSVILTIPICITCFQNVFLGIGISRISNKELLFYIVINVVFSWMLLFLGILDRKFYVPEIKKMLICFLLLLVYSLVISYFNHVNTVAFISSFRNISSPFVFFLVGMLLSERCNKDKFTSIVCILFIIVFLMGIYEYFFDSDFWIKLHIGELWNKKGIYINKLTQKPYNHYSAEVFFGKQLPRMVSTFAEPVNLGSFCLFVGMISWWKKRYVLLCMAMMMGILTVSKGALLGFIVLFSIVILFKFSYRDRIRLIPVIIGLLSAAFIVMLNFSQSVVVHVSGFFNAFTDIKSYILGHGIGNAGVYANLYSEANKIVVQESGLGVVLVQIGIPGVLCYAYMLYTIMKKAKRYNEKRTKILIYAMALSVYMLFAFSESGIGPNTCSYFMMLLGMFTCEYKTKKEVCGESRNINMV